MKTAIFPAVAICALSACNLTGDPTNSGFATPNSAGVLSKASSSQALTGQDFSGLTGNGYGYQVGAVTNDGLQGFAGLVSGASVSVPTSTTATLSGEFEVAFIDFILTSSVGEVTGVASSDYGLIELQADFANGTLVGGGTGLDGGFTNFYLNENELTVDGRIDGTTLTGTVTYNGVSGSLQGLVGGNEAIGAFHGHTDNDVFAGGFIAN